MGYIICQYRSLSDEEWNNILSVIPLMTGIHITCRGYKITQFFTGMITYTSYRTIYKDIQDRVVDAIDIVDSQSWRLYLVNHIFNLYAPGAFSLKDIKLSFMHILNAMKYQSICLEDKILFSRDNKSVVEYSLSTGPDILIRECISLLLSK